jgi:hypothetical protein
LRQPGTPALSLKNRSIEHGQARGVDQAAKAPAQGDAAANQNLCLGVFIMGRKTRNLEVVTDYADGTHFVRLHRDVLLPASICEAVRRLLNAGRWEEAKNLTLEHAMENAHDEIELFFDSTAARLDQKQRAEPNLSRNPELAEYSCG